MKRYISVFSIIHLLIVHCHDPLVPSTELIIVPRSVLDGLVTTIHIMLNHPPKHQLQLGMRRHFFALDLNKAIGRVSDDTRTYDIFGIAFPKMS